MAAALHPVREPGGRRVEEQSGHGAAVGDLDAHGAGVPGDRDEGVELRVPQQALGAPGALRADPAEQPRVRGGDGPAQQRPQTFVGAYVLVVVDRGGQGQGVHRPAAAEGAAHDDDRRQGVAEDLQDASFPLRGAQSGPVEAEQPAVERAMVRAMPRRAGWRMGPPGDVGRG